MQVRVLGAAAITTAEGGTVGRLDRKARELLTILALRAPASTGIDELGLLLWEDPPPSAARTIQAHLSRIRRALRAAHVDGDLERQGRDRYRLVTGPGTLDVEVVAAGRARGHALLLEGRADAAALVLADARAQWSGEPELPETTAAVALVQGWRQERHQLTVEHLTALVEGSEPGRALGELERLTVADPLAEPLWTCRVRALGRSGHQVEALRAAEEARRALGEVGLAPGAALRAAESEVLAGVADPGAPAPPSPASAAPAVAPAAAPAVGYARRGTGGQTAYTTFGKGDHDVVVLNPAMITIDGLFDEPHLATALGRLGASARVTCLDRRGIGLSDPLQPGRPPLDDWAADVLGVLDATGADRPILVANFDTGLVALEVAARHPDRVGALVLVHCFACFTRSDDYPYGIDLATADTVVADSVATPPDGEEIDTLAYVAPSVSADSGFRAWWQTIGRRAASPSTAAAVLTAAARIDLRSRLPAVTAPTLLLHRRSCLGVDIGHAHHLLHHLPRARLEVLPGTDSLWFTDRGDVPGRIVELLGEVSAESPRDRRGAPRPHAWPGAR